MLPAIQAAKIRVLRWSQLSDAARKQALEFYEEEIDPLLTPVTIDPSHPFPQRSKQSTLYWPSAYGTSDVA